MKKIGVFGVSAAVVLLIAACDGAENATRTGTGTNTGTDTGADTNTDGAQYTATYKAVIATNCASSGCHGGSTSPNLSTFAGVKSKRERMLARINAGTMPPSSAVKANWNSTDKASLVEYLTNSADFK